MTRTLWPRLREFAEDAVLCVPSPHSEASNPKQKESNFMKKFTIKFIAAVLAVCLPFGAVMIAGFASQPQFGDTFLGELADKQSRLEGIDEPKVVIIGGSSTAFGLRSDLLEDELGMPVVNFGLYATLGTKLMIDLARANLNDGDIVVIAPELDAQTMSLYFNAESAWQAFDSDMSMLRHARFKNYGALAGSFWEYAVSKLRYSRQGGLNPDGVYSKSSFNEYGDITYSRPHNIMLLEYGPNHPITLDSSIVSVDFAEYVNEFTKFAESKGASVYFDFPPMNCLAVEQDTDEIYEFYRFLDASFECEIIGNINSYILDERYFYDSNYHLNDSGVLIRTALLAEDIKRALNDDSPVSIALPPPPEKPKDESASRYDMNAEYFLYEPYASGVIITGVTDAAKSMTELTLPRFADGVSVLAIGERAFSECAALTTVTIHDNVAQFYDNVFDGCGNLEMIILTATNANAIAVGNNFLGGTRENCTIYLTREGFGNFVADYFWSKYSSRMDIVNLGE